MEPTTGRCLCGSVRFEIDGPLRDVSLCHCVECRRWHGHVCAMTSAPRERLRFLNVRRRRDILAKESNQLAALDHAHDVARELRRGRPDRRVSTGAVGEASREYP